MNASILTLRTLTETDEVAFFQGMKAWDGHPLYWYTFIWKPGMPYLEMLDRLRKDTKGEDLPDGWVANTMLYAFVDNEIIGRFSFRHELNDKLRHRGGHIGYSVAPRFRSRGFASEILRQGLEACRKKGLHQVLVTCSDDKGHSIRVIEKCGGKLAETFRDKEEDEIARRYWIQI